MVAPLEGRALMALGPGPWTLGPMPPLTVVVQGSGGSFDPGLGSGREPTSAPTVDGRLRNLEYRSDNGSLERLDVYLPSGQAPAGGWPVVMAIHGGGWRRFSKEGYGRRMSLLAEHGFAVVAPNYTLTRRGVASWPANLEDLRGAVRWIRESAPFYGFDPERIAAAGESAGGHLALLLGTMPETTLPGRPSARISAVIDFFGPTDLARLDSESPSAAPAIRGLLGTQQFGDPSLYDAASPMTYVGPTSRPVLIIHGDRDSVVPISQAVHLDEALSRFGVPHQFIRIPGARHGFGFGLRGANLIGEVVDFLNTYI